jgi:hypothetical protein
MNRIFMLMLLYTLPVQNHSSSMMRDCHYAYVECDAGLEKDFGIASFDRHGISFLLCVRVCVCRKAIFQQLRHGRT